MIERTFNRIFGIGLPKTGTHSLNEALRMLGFNAFHYARSFRKMILSGNYNFPDEFKGKQWDALTYLGEWHWAQLDEAFPNSRFILGTRSLDTWLESMSVHYATPPRKGMNTKTTIEIFGTLRFNKSRFTHLHGEHYRRVLEYFSFFPEGRSKHRGRLLVFPSFELSDADKWERLCKFLEVPVMVGTYPHIQRRYHTKGGKFLGKRLAK